MIKKRLTVIGGGAAGFFCAVNAARINPDLEVRILEKSNKLLSKVKVSGGGRCNVTHACFSIAEMVKKYPRGGSFLKKAFHHFFTNDAVEWFTARGLPLKTEGDGRMFPQTNLSQTVIDCLINEAEKYNVHIYTNTAVTNIIYDNGQFNISLSDASSQTADFICIACGGYPKAVQYDWLKQLKHTIKDPVPSLFTFNIPDNPVIDLKGVSVERAVVKVTGTTLQEENSLLITHWGMSGPAVLRLSAWGAEYLAAKQYDFSIAINWIPPYHENTAREIIQQIRFDKASQKIINRNPFLLPQRLWEYIVKQSGINENIRWADLPAKEQNRLIKNLCGQELRVQGKTTFKEEFVTAGGINLEEINPDTMQSKIIPGLFFAGEIMNVDGITGGFNFQNAWTTGWIAAKNIAAIP